MESLSSVMKVRPQKPDHHQELKVTKKATAVKSETKKNSEVGKIAGHSTFKNLNVRILTTSSINLHHLSNGFGKRLFICLP